MSEQSANGNDKWYEVWARYFYKIEDRAGWQKEIAHPKWGVRPVPTQEELCDGVRTLARKWNDGMRRPLLGDYLREMRATARQRDKNRKEEAKEYEDLVDFLRDPPAREGAAEDAKRDFEKRHGKAFVEKAEREAK